MLSRFGENVWRLRTERRLSQEDVSFRASIDRTQISLIELGNRAVLLPTFVRLAGALDVPADELLRGTVFQPNAFGEGSFIVEPSDLPSVKWRP